MKKKIKLHGALKAYLCWPVYLGLLLIVMTALVLVIDVRAGLVSALGTALYILISVNSFSRYSPSIINDLVSFSQQYENLENRLVDHLEIILRCRMPSWIQREDWCGETAALQS